VNPLALFAVGAVAVVALRRREPQRVSPPLRVSGDDTEAPESELKKRTIEVACSSGRPANPWKCGRGNKIPIPQPSDVLPASVVAAGGPIVQAIEHGIGIVKQIFAALGWKRRCTVVGGEMIVLDHVPNEGRPRFWLQVEGGFEGVPPQVVWTFDDEDGVDDDVELPLVGEVDVAATEGEGAIPGPQETDHWRDGRNPPASWHWPHGNLQQWRAYGGDGASSLARRPIAYVQRSPAGSTLSLLVWLPPRAPATHLNAWGKQVIDHCPQWVLTWRIIP
jgi:hypothetical protein